MVDKEGTLLAVGDGVLVVRTRWVVDFTPIDFELREEPSAVIYWGRIEAISEFGAKVKIGVNYVTVVAQSAHLLKCNLLL